MVESLTLLSNVGRISIDYGPAVTKNSSFSFGDVNGMIEVFNTTKFIVTELGSVVRKWSISGQ